MAAETHGRGWWATLDEWWVHAQQAVSAGDVQADEAWAILPRVRWLAPARVAEHAVFSLEAMRERIETHWRERGVAEPLLIVSLTRAAPVAGGAPTQGDWIERERGFIVPDYWAPRARHRIEELAERADAAARRALAASADDGAPSL